MLKRAKRASHIDPPASSDAIMRRASPYRGENPGPGEDVEGELDPRPGIREQPGSQAEIQLRRRVVGYVPILLQKSLASHVMAARQLGRALSAAPWERRDWGPYRDAFATSATE